METIYDWLTVSLFAGLIVLFLQRSSAAEPRDSIWHYLVAAAGCAITNYLGNEGYHTFGVLLLLATIGFTFYMLDPLGRGGSSK